jgi:hypothetical protein
VYCTRAQNIYVHAYVHLPLAEIGVHGAADGIASSSPYIDDVCVHAVVALFNEHAGYFDKNPWKKKFNEESILFFFSKSFLLEKHEEIIVMRYGCPTITCTNNINNNTEQLQNNIKNSIVTTCIMTRITYSITCECTVCTFFFIRRTVQYSSLCNFWNMISPFS